MEGFEEALDRWFKACQSLLDDYMAMNSPTLPRETLSMERGRRYIRIVRNTTSQNIAWAFIDTTNGDVMKVHSWKAPAKTARGNVMDSSNGMSRMTPYGPEYLS